MRKLSLIVFLLFLPNGLLAQSPHGKSIGNLDCSSCHESTTWEVKKGSIEFNHDLTNFKLTGQHNIVECQSCHKSLVFSEAKTDCFSCHKDIHQGTVGFNCERCHTPETWIVKDIKLVHQQGRFPLVGVHQSIDCSQCHKRYNNLNFQPIGASCYSCHSNDYNNTRSPNHAAAGFSTDCESCHSLNNRMWAAQNFKHDFFPLTGGHKVDNCFACHKQGTFAGLSNVCVTCHLANYNSTTNPNHSATGLSTDCQTCHTTTAFIPSTFNHTTTGFALSGKHTEISCNSCHTGTPLVNSDCYSCHKTNYDNTINPSHTNVGFGKDCQTCHSTTTWQSATFNHATTGFTLTGVHLTIQCSSCHTGTAVLNALCITCHQANYNTALNHLSQNYPTTCEMCHNTTDWTSTTFNHQTTIFPLTGAHTTVLCSNCHQTGFAGTPTACVSCHQTNYNNSTNPSHTSLQLATTCETCHTTNPGWQPAIFPIHNNYYTLAGAHTSLTCIQCHNGNYLPTSVPTDCYSCHTNDYNNTTNPNHQAALFPHDCQTCHSQTVWSPSTFNHDQQYFPIYSGSHNNRWTLCSQCHQSSTSFVTFTCMSSGCHPQTETVNQHVGVQGFIYAAEQCYACHPKGTSGGFDHATSIFPLTGAHITVDCIQCHQNGYPNTPTTCVSCHQANFNATTNPNHKTLALSTDCITCHTTATGWKPATFAIHNNYFVLVGTHSTTATCSSCHNGNYNNTPNQCVGCHLTSYNNSQNPKHQPAGISTLCQTCHNSVAWIPSTFIHTTTGFTLTGVHLTIQCSSCHAGTTTGLSTLCISCHQTNYNTALNHVAQSYPTTCEMCHNSTDWTQTTFNHQSTPFPLTGAHTTVLCTSCHQTGFAGTPTACLSCHQTNYNNSTNPSHTTLQLATTCETCHSTNAGWKPATFSIHNNYYALAGAHTSLTCIQCHNGNYLPTSVPTDCYSCHTTDYNNTTNPNHKVALYSHDCQTCHSQTAWIPSTFNHDQLYFPINSGKHLNRWTLCSQCHQTPTDYSAFTCMSSGCHAQSTTNSHHTGVSGYVYLASACYSCHPRGSAGKVMYHQINKSN